MIAGRGKVTVKRLRVEVEAEHGHEQRERHRGKNDRIDARGAIDEVDAGRRLPGEGDEPDHEARKDEEDWNRDVP